MNDQTTGLVLRELSGVAELKRAEQFQKTVWGEDDPPDNSDIMLAIQHEGGLVAGAFRGDQMLGFLFGFPTSESHIQHSHRLAVHPDSRGMGLGAKLKWFQRDWCLHRGITLVRWTYDPLRSINAGLNITRLGATAGIYHKDYYGQMVGINAGVASDRLLAEWELNAPHVAALEKGNNTALPATANDSLTIEIPKDLDTLLSTDLDKAVAERLRVREAITAAFVKGYRITAFDIDAGRYLMTRA
ncbi:MAG: GNAT family N-acetyltransferase [Rhodobacteraceae bacterium]|nr:GNAT family N-acetyltransferase [Paracoccaceae bacterium]